MSTNQIPAGIPAECKGARHVWIYRNAEGEVLGLVARHERSGRRKWFVPHFERDGEQWKPGAGPEPRPLFGLDTLPGDAGTVIYITEGERCAAALHALGLSAVTSLNGSNAADNSDWTPLARFEKVVILPDHDEPGEGYAKAVAGLLARLPGHREIRIARLPGLLDKGDIVDWIAGRVQGWDGYGPLDDEQVPGLRDELLDAIGDCAEKVNATAMESAEVDSEPLPLTPERTPPAPYPFDALGEVLGDAARAMQHAIQAPDALCGQSVLAAASLAAQAHADVLTPDGRHLPLSLFCLSVAESGERKSAVDRLALRPHEEYEARLREEFRDAFAEYGRAAEAYDTAAKAAKLKHKNNGRERIEDALLALGTKPEPPPEPVVLVGDFTVEGVRRVLANGQPSIGLFTDEGGRMMGGHGMMPEHALKTLTTLSGLWDGRGCTTARGGEGVIALNGKRCSLHLMMQPSVAPLLFDDAQTTGQGFLWRCLPVWPGTLAGSRFYRPIDVSETPAYRRYCDAMEGLLWAPRQYCEGSTRDLDPRLLRMSTDAAAEWARYHDHIERDQAPDMPLESLRGFASKAAEHVLRIAGVLALVENTEADEVDAGHVHRGIALVQFYAGEMLRIRERGSVDAEAEKAERLLRWMKSTGKASFSLRYICQYGPSKLRQADTLRPLLVILERHRQVHRLDPSAEIWRLAA